MVARLAKIFVDTSVLVALSGISRLNLLWSTFPDRLVIPQAVVDELEGLNLSLPFGRRYKRKKRKPFWDRISSEVSEAVSKGWVECLDLTDTESTLALSLARQMDLGEAAVYAMASCRGGICCSNDMRAVRARCESHGVPLLGVFGILHKAYRLRLLNATEADRAISSMLANGVIIPRVGFGQVREWFEEGKGVCLFH